MAGPTQYVSGIISTLNWDQVIEALLSRERAYIYSLEDRISENLTKLTAWSSIDAGLVTLQNYLTILSQSSTFQATSATSDKQDILTATVSGAGQPGLYPLKVYQLSQTHQLISRGFEDTESEIASTNDTITMEVGGGWIDKKTPLSWLNGQSGIYRGSIKMTDRSGSSATIDLNGALTIEDVLDTINENTTIKVTASVFSDALKIVDNTGETTSSLKVEEVENGVTAASLGILKDIAGDSFIGTSINTIEEDTYLSLLNDGRGIQFGICTTLASDLEASATSAILSSVEGLTVGDTIRFSKGSSGAGNNEFITIDTISKATGAITWTGGIGEGYTAAETTVSRIDLKITDSSTTDFYIDLSAAQTVADVLAAIDNSIDSSGNLNTLVSAGINGEGTGIILEDSAGGASFAITALNGRSTKSDLGFEGVSLENTNKLLYGKRVISTLNSTLLSTLNGGDGISDGSITITDRNNDSSSIDLSSRIATTLSANYIADNTYIEVTDITGFVIGNDIRITNGTNSEYRTITNISGTEVHFQDALTSGYTTVNASVYTGHESVSNVLNAISNDASINVTAEVDKEGNAILILDDTSQTISNLIVEESGGAVAGELGILKSVAASSFEGEDLSPQYISYSTQLEDLNGGQGVNANKIKITDRSEASAEIDLSNAETIAEVINAINAASGINVTASINSQGNGILITDNTGQSDGPLKVEEAGGTTARDLNILESTNSTTIDGSFEVTVQLSSEDTTLAGIRDAINAADAEVSAAIINDGSSFNPYRLLITSQRSGEVGRMMVDAEFSAGEVLELNTSTSAKNAIVVLQAEEGGNILITDTSNQLDQVIPGVTINLLSADPAETVSVKVEADIAAVQQSIINLIGTYNNLMDAINSQQSYNADTEQRGGPLFGNVSLMNIRNQLRRVITDPIKSSASLTSIFDLGISADLTGHLNVDNSRLTEVLKDDLEGVKDFFSLSENVAHSSFETTPSASSTLSGDFNVESVNNGDTSSDNWGSPGGGWMDGTQSTFPDYLTLTFDTIRTLHKVTIHTLDSDTDPASSYGIKDYELQYLTRGGNPDNDDDWQTHTTITDNSEGTITHYLSSISTQAIRLKINNSNDGQYSRIIEFEAYQRTGIAGALKNYLNSITTADTGLIACVEDSLYSQNEDYQGRIEAQEKLMEMKEEKLVRDFVQMEQYLAVMQVQSSWLQQQMSILSALAGSQ